jgi:alpha-mannosidase
MHDDRDVVEGRISRELWERVLPLVHPDRRPLTIEAGPSCDELGPFAPGTSWGAPWATTWFRFTGHIPDDWAGRRVEAVIDLGFHPLAAGFQCEGLVVEPSADGALLPVQGIHPRRTNLVVASTPGPVTVLLEAASNPSFPGYRPSPLGSPETAGDRLLYRLRTAHLVVVDPEVEAVAYDLEVLDGTMRQMSLGDPRRARIRRDIASALDALQAHPPDVERARTLIAPHLAPVSGHAARHHVVATGHAHIDTAWLWPIRETKRKCIRTFASAVRLMDDYPEYRFVCSQAQQYAWIEQSQPALFEKIRERVHRGQWLPVGGMWVEADMNLPSGESLARQIVFGQRYFEERFGQRCEEVWIPDVFGYPAGLPQVFAAGGMRRFITQKLSWNKQNRFPHHTFWWEGLDGTRTLTHFPPVDTYNAEITPEEVIRSVDRFREHGWSSWSLMPFGHGDGGGGPTREMLERRRRLAALDPAFDVVVGGPDDLFEGVEHEAAHGAPVPVWRGELYFEMHRGTLTSQIRTKLGNRRCERLLVETELWSATVGRRADVDDLWREVLTQQFHDILPGSSIAWVHADAEEVFERVRADLDDRIAGLLHELAGGAAIVANPSDAPFDGIVTVDATTADRIGAGAGARQATADGRVAIRTRAPALGVAALVALPVDDRVVVSESSMANRHIAVRWDATGMITSIIDIDAAREVVPVGEHLARLELAVDRPVEYDAWDVESWTRASGRPLPGTPDSIEVLDRGPLVGRVRVTWSFGPSTASIVYRLDAVGRRLTIELDLDWQHDEHLLSMAFPVDVRTDGAACDVQFGVVRRPTHSSSPWDAAKFEVCAHRFVDVSEPGFGVAVLNDGRFGHGLLDGAIRVSVARAAKYPDPGADHGHHRVTLAVLPHAGDLAIVRAEASNLNQPVRIVDPPADAAPAPPLPVVEIDGAGALPSSIEVDAVKLADDGSGDLVVRLHESCGRREPFTLRAHRRIVDASRCNLLEDPERGEEVSDGIVGVTLRPFELVTFRLRLGDPFDGRTLSA